MGNKISPEKWNENHIEWWNNLSLEQKHFYKNHFLKIREKNKNSKCPYPNMYDVTNIRVSKLSNKQIHRIWVFREYII